ncbi:MAG: hypothetical protein JRI23_18540 [Deltaproteobacteria bacterium]|nr:hypothetical protein [Deltaproteobacteria bacterium]MBW2533858.1 hypothetical protein [Deltaproteobacteria bacterium]
MTFRRWQLVGWGLVVALCATACGKSDEEVLAELCAKWDECSSDTMGSIDCPFEMAVEECSNSDDLIEHFEDCVSVPCEQMIMECFGNMPSCQQSSSSKIGLPWLPGRDYEEDVVTPTPAPPSPGAP